jgi:hypothetical protein
MAGARKQTRYLPDDKLLAEFEALSDNDVRNSDSECDSDISERESESDAEGISDGDENDAPRELPALCFSGRGEIFFHTFMILTMKIHVFRPIWMKIAHFLTFSNFFFHSKLCNT